MNMIHKTNETRISRKREQKLEQILLAGLDLIELEGLEGLTMHKLAQRLDYAVGALYRYVPSKEDLLAQLQILALNRYNTLYAEAEKQLGSEVIVLAKPAVCAELFWASRQVSPALYA